MKCKLCGKEVSFLVKGVCNDCMREYDVVEEEEEKEKFDEVDDFHSSGWIKTLKIISKILFFAIFIVVGLMILNSMANEVAINNLLLIWIGGSIGALVLIVITIIAENIEEINYKIK